MLHASAIDGLLQARYMRRPCNIANGSRPPVRKKSPSGAASSTTPPSTRQAICNDSGDYHLSQLNQNVS